VSVIFYMSANLLTIRQRVQQAHQAGKYIMIHLDLAEGIGKDRTGIRFLAGCGVDGILSTKGQLIRFAREQQLFTVQRFFAVDSSGSVTASSLRLKGTITFLNADGTSAGTLSAADLRTGAYQAANNYGSWNSAYSSTSPGGYCYGGAGGGYNWNNTKNRGTSSLPNVYLGSCSCTSLLCSSFYLGSYQGFWQSVEINGVTKTILVAN
jgi:hypothetical protein